MSAGFDHARLAILVHEVRSPVAALSAVAETVADLPADDSMRDELVRLALAASRSIERIVMDLAVASVRMESLDAVALVRDAVASFAVRGESVATEGDDAPLLVDADPVRLRQALDNLIANALAHGGSAGAVAVRTTRSKDGIAIAVSDSGPGVAPDELERIFDLGVRLDANSSGSGLGLAVSRAIVDAHGGSLEVESTPGAGSTFTIVLPLRERQPAT
jgi:two-component system sensor histidine kinase BaeS